MKALGPPAGLPLFVYGTLQDAGFASRLLERPVEIEPARLLDFELLRLEGLSSPAVFEAPGEVVSGGLCRRLTGEDYERLDAYEGVHEGLYVRLEAHAVAGEPRSVGASEPVFVYVVTEKTLRRYGAL
ncbi:MAG: gamma-glutamylcyclotransferase family protein [Candidatus Rokuibacteriota bacterium]